MKRIPSLDGLRAISISLVILGHLTAGDRVPVFFAPYGSLGVRIFFVISGYLITAILAREHDRTATIGLKNFYIRRAYRILPAAFCFTVPILIFYNHSLRWFDMVAAMLYLVNFPPIHPWIIGHLWSLSVEEQFYLIWPSVLKKWYAYRVPILLGTIAMSPVCRVALYIFKVKISSPIFFLVADNLAVGCLLAIIAPRVPRIRSFLMIPMVLGLVLIPQFQAPSAAHTLFMLFVLQPCLYLCIAGILLHVVRSPYRILNFGPVVWLGKISYSLYLWQQPFLLAKPYTRYSVFAALGMACLSYYLIEQPVLRLRERNTVGRGELQPDILSKPTANFKKTLV